MLDYAIIQPFSFSGYLNMHSLTVTKSLILYFGRRDIVKNYKDIMRKLKG